MTGFYVSTIIDGTRHWLEQKTGFWFTIKEKGTLFRHQKAAENLAFEWGIDKGSTHISYSNYYIAYKDVSKTRFYWNGKNLEWSVKHSRVTVYQSQAALLRDLRKYDIQIDWDCVKTVIRINNIIDNGVENEH